MTINKKILFWLRDECHRKATWHEREVKRISRMIEKGEGFADKNQEELVRETELANKLNESASALEDVLLG